MKLGNPSVLNTLSAGLFTSLITIVLSLSYASLIFSGELAPFLAHGIALAITSVVVVGFVQTMWSDSAHLVVQVDDDTAPVMALFIGFLIASLPHGLSPEQILSNVLAAVVISTFIAGLTLTIFGYFKLGNLLQFLPYSAIGGYFAAVGWLLLVGALNSLVPFEVNSIESIFTLFSDTQTILKWLPALIIGVCLRWMSDKISTGHLLAFAAIVVTLLFYTAAFSLGADLGVLQSEGYLIGPFANTQSNLFSPITHLNWSEVQANAFINNIASIATISLIALLSFTLCVSAVALNTRKELDANKELQVSGMANIANSLLGGLFALPSVSSSKLSHDLHPIPSKLLGLSGVAVAVLIFYLGLDLIAYIPRMVLGVLLIFIAFGFLHEWLIKGYKKFGPIEYSVIPIILIVSVFYGFLESIVFGIVAAIILFAINYSRIRVIKYQASGAELRSNVVRRSEQNQYLKRHGEKARIFKLQGFLFFGTAGTLYKEVTASLANSKEQSVEYVLLDFSQVSGIDSSATLNFERLAQRLKEHNTNLVLTGLKHDLLAKLIHGGFDPKNGELIHQFLDIDQGLEWCENRILDDLRLESGSPQSVLELIAGDLSTDEIELLKRYLTKRRVTKGELLTDLGEQSNEVYMLESCTASAYILDSNNIERRIDGAGRGAIYGEIGFFLNIPRTAIVKADSDGELYSLSFSSLKKMESEAPKLASAINRYMLRIVTERLASTTRSLRTVL